MPQEKQLHSTKYTPKPQNFSKCPSEFSLVLCEIVNCRVLTVFNLCVTVQSELTCKMPYRPIDVEGICNGVKAKKVSSQQKSLENFQRQEKRKRASRVVESDPDSDFEDGRRPPPPPPPSRRNIKRKEIVYCCAQICWFILFVVAMLSDFGPAWNLVIALLMLVPTYCGF